LRSLWRSDPTQNGSALPDSRDLGAFSAVAEARELQPRLTMQAAPLGRLRWAIAEGYIPRSSHGPEPELTSHETACILNTCDEDARVELTLFFRDRETAGPYRVTVPARRTLHLRFNDLVDPEPVPRGTDFATVIESDVPIIVQHTRLDSRQAENALMTTIAYAGDT
jgi:hypothetical protein